MPLAENRFRYLNENGYIEGIEPFLDFMRRYPAVDARGTCWSLRMDNCRALSIGATCISAIRRRTS